MYTVKALTLGEKITYSLPSDFQKRVVHYRSLNNASLVLTWFTIVSIKFSFLFIFKKLIDRIRPLIAYWWVFTVFNGAIAIYGATVPILACPLLDGGKSCESTISSPDIWSGG